MCPMWFSFSCNLTDSQLSLITTGPKESRTLSIGQHTFPFSILLPERLPSVLTTDSVNINYQVTAYLHPVSRLPFSQPYQVTKPVILLQVDDLPNDIYYGPKQVQFTSERTDRVQCEVRMPYRVLPRSGTVPLTLHLNLRGNSTKVSKVTIELWERAFRVQRDQRQHIGENLPSKVQVDERRVSSQSCSISEWPGSSMKGETISITKRLLFKVPQMPLTIWADEPGRIVSTDRRSLLPKGYCNNSGMYSLVNLEIQHVLRVLVNVNGQLSSESTTKTSFPVDDTAQGESRVHILGLTEQQPQEAEDETEPPSYRRSFMTRVVEGDRLVEIDCTSFETLQDFGMLMSRTSLVDTPLVTVPIVTIAETRAPGADNQTATVRVHPPGYEESIRSSFTSSREANSIDRIRGASLDHQSLHDSAWDSNSGRPSTSTDTYAQNLANYTE
ncbi:hypothetical protein FBU30_009015 [Linnemannia zychae]|nr:hypothetical protein FBU30_009015 [Linnemannia zychae]